MNGPPLLEINELATSFFTKGEEIRAVNQVSLTLKPGEILGLVGESGCGKSATAHSILRLIPSPPGKIVSGEIRYRGKDLLQLTEKEMRRIRGNQISMIFQEPMTALNPVFTVGNQIGEVFRVHRGMSRREALQASIEMLKKVRMPEPEKRAREYPHQLSGGMRQRVMIAMALACEPELLIADEPTTALDVTIQAQILDLMRDLQRDLNTAVVLITHDLGVVAEMADRVAVMYAGEIVEETDVRTIFKKPLHPYTRGLIGSIPVLGDLKDNLTTIPGVVPSLIDLPVGCRFASRCTARIEYGLEICLEKKPSLLEVAADHKVRCWLYEEDSGG